MGKPGLSVLFFVIFFQFGLPANIVDPNAAASDQQLVNDFYNSSIGIAFTMLSTGSWENPGGDAPGVNHMDRAVFFQEPPSSYQGYAQQAMTIVRNGLGMAPYLGAGPYGLALRIGSDSNFWKYFQKNSQGDICGLPHDGFKCGALPAWRLSVANESYGWFENQVKSVLNGFQGNNYNEFDVNGLSSSALAGVIYWANGGPPSDWMKNQMCKLLKYANPSRSTPWPVYKYYYNSLTLEDHLDCDGGLAPSPLPPSSSCSSTADRTDCGFSGVSEGDCKSRGCCWSPAPGRPWCFHPNGEKMQVTKPETNSSTVKLQKANDIMV